MAVTHSTVVVVADDGISPVGTNEWNASHSIGTDLSPDADGGAALGTTTKKFTNLFLGSGGKIDFNSGDVTITHAADTVTFAGAANHYQFDNTIKPNANGGAALGTGTLAFSNLFLGSLGKIDWNNGAIKLSHDSIGGVTLDLTSATDQH